MRRRLLNLIVIALVSILTFSFGTVLLAKSPNLNPDTVTIIEKLQELQNDVSELPKEAFKNAMSAEGHRNALENKIQAVIHQIEAGAFTGSLNKLQNDVKKTIIDWIEPDYAEDLIELVDEVIALIMGVNPSPERDFIITASPDLLTMPQDSSAKSTITVKSLNGFKKLVQLSITSAPINGVTTTIQQSQVTPPPNGSVNATLNVDVFSYTKIGEYIITVTGTSYLLTHSVNITVEVTALPSVSDFSIAAFPASLAIQRGGSNISIISVTSLNGFSQSVDLTITSSPIGGVTNTLNPLHVIPPPNKSAISVLTINVATTAVTGSYAITVTGTNGTLIRSTNIALQIMAPPIPPVPDFSIAAFPASLTVQQGNSNVSTLIIVSLREFSGTVDLNLASQPILGVSITLNPPQVTLSPNGFATSTLMVEVDTSAPPDEYMLVVSGTSDALKHSVEISLEILPAPPPPIFDFSIIADPSSLNVQQGGSNISIISITSLTDASQPVDLTISSLPIDGVTITLNPLQVIPPPNKPVISILTIDVETLTATGSYTITVTGTSGTITRSTNIVLEVMAPPVPPVPDFSIAAFPASIVVHQDSSNVSTIIIVSLREFSGTVDLSVTSQPILGVTLTLSPSSVILSPNDFATSTLTVESDASASPDEYMLVVSGTSDSLKHSVEISLEILSAPPPSIFDFSIIADPSSLNVQQGGSNTSIISITSLTDASQPVDLIITSPSIAGVTTTLNPLQVIPPPNKSAFSILTVDVATTVAAGLYTITVTGTNGTLTRSTNIVLEVRAPPVPPVLDFSITAFPASLTVQQGNVNVSTLIIVSLNGFGGTVDLDLESQPILGVTLTLNPTQVALSSEGFATSTLTVEVDVTALPGQYILIVTGTSGVLEHSVNLPLKIVAETTPPIILSVLRLPDRVNYNDTATVFASVIDVGSGVKEVVLSYSGGVAWINVTMTLKDGLFSADIPVFLYSTVVKYRVYASDKAGNSATPSSIDFYTVVDSYSPVIGVPSWAPKEPDANVDITVNVTVTEPSDASGVGDVALLFKNRTLGYWMAVPMTFSEGNWTAKLSNQSDTLIDLKITAVDMAGNSVETDSYQFQVKAPAGFPLALILLIIIILAALIGSAAYFLWRRRQRKRGGEVAPPSTPAPPSPPPVTPVKKPTKEAAPVRGYGMVSFVVPAHNEEGTISERIVKAYERAASHAGPSEIIVVDDGSVDNTYEAVWSAVESNRKRWPNIPAKVVKLSANLGRDEAVRFGRNKATGEIVETVNGESAMTNPPVFIGHLFLSL